MSAGPTAKVVREFFDRYNRQDVDGIMSLVADQCQAVYPFLNSHAPEEWRELILQEFTAFPNARVLNLRIATHGGYVSAEFDWTGTRVNEFLGRPASNRTYDIPCVLTFDIEGGKIIGVRYYFNTALWDVQDESTS